MTHKSWFTLPPLQEFYYQKMNPFYKKLPNYRLGCLNEEKQVM